MIEFIDADLWVKSLAFLYPVQLICSVILQIKFPGQVYTSFSSISIIFRPRKPGTTTQRTLEPPSRGMVQYDPPPEHCNQRPWSHHRTPSSYTPFPDHLSHSY